MNSFRTIIQDSSSGHSRIILDSTCTVFLFNDVLVFALLSDSRERRELDLQDEPLDEAEDEEALYIVRKVLHLSILFEFDEKESEKHESCIILGFPQGKLALFGDSNLLKKWSKQIWDNGDKIARRDFNNAQGIMCEFFLKHLILN